MNTNRVTLFWNSTKDKDDYLETPQEQRFRLYRRTIKLELAVGLISLVIWSILAPFYQTPAMWLLIAVTTLINLIFWVTYLLSNSVWLEFSIYLNIVSFFGFVTALNIILDTGQIGVLYLFSAVLALILINIPVAGSFTLLGGLISAAITLWRSEVFFRLDNAGSSRDNSLTVWSNLIITEFCILGLFCLFVFLYQYLDRTTKIARRQNSQLQQALNTLQKRLEEIEISQKVLFTATDLKATAMQLSSLANQQASATSEVGVSMQQLTASARQIALSSEEVAHYTGQAVTNSYTVKAVAAQAANFGSEGQQIIAEITSQISAVGTVYRDLVVTLSNLAHNSQAVQEAVGLIEDFADETQLLSLNAAIEAAGAGQHGERFAVIAQEVKALANRSKTATQEINTLLNILEVAVTQSINTAKAGQQQVEQTIAKAQEGGHFINNLAEVTGQAAEETVRIVDLLQGVKKRTEDIRLATQQQQEAGQQVVEVLSGVTESAGQTSFASTALLETAQSLENLSLNLRDTLAAA